MAQEPCNVSLHINSFVYFNSYLYFVWIYSREKTSVVNENVSPFNCMILIQDVDTLDGYSSVKGGVQDVF